MKEDYQKALKRSTLLFLPNTVPFNTQGYQKQRGLELVKKHSFISYTLSDHVDDVIQSGFWVIPKITSANLCNPIHDIINSSTFICPFVSGKCGNGKFYKKNDISRTKRAF